MKRNKTSIIGKATLKNTTLNKNENVQKRIDHCIIT
jgi:hypothetical protein